ncbi:MAG: EF-P lysine aminoacylase GenX [Planctomycetaceae bacterium]|nr:MAG: EF-P lysine aminoacylase GenX [Planctomycetaceae bacterium]
MPTRTTLELRARVRSGLRALFDADGFLEVDTPVLSAEVLPEAHIDPIAVFLEGVQQPPHYLQASPEALMKRLLAHGSGAIYQFAHAFRAGERGAQHDEEFVLLEWYAPGSTLSDTARLLERICREFLGTSGIDRVLCSQAFREHAGVDPLLASLPALQAAGHRAGLQLPESDADLPEAVAWDRWFEILLSDVVAPQLGRGRPTMLEAWPVSQAAFAKLSTDNPPSALRCELFVEGVEVANGWEEDTSRRVLHSRIAAANHLRATDGRGVLPLPQQLLHAHREDADREDRGCESFARLPTGAGMPEGTGVALGFDRLLMLAAGAASIDAVRCYNSRNA